jgi:chaperonin GroES
MTTSVLLMPRHVTPSPPPLRYERLMAKTPKKPDDETPADKTPGDKPAPQTSGRGLEIVEPIGKRVLIRKDDDKKQTKAGIHLPDKVEIPTLTGRILTISAEVERDENYPLERYDRVLFHPKHAIPVDFEGGNRLYVVPVEDVVAVFRREE